MFLKALHIRESVFVSELRKVGRLRPEAFVFLVSLLFYLFLWFINPGNKIIAASFVGLIFIFYFKLKDFRTSLLLVYLASLVVFTGKSYPIELIPAGFYPKELYPFGYIEYFIISPKHILSFMMFAVMVRDFITKRFKPPKIKAIDLTIISFFAWGVISDFLVSRRPEVSILFSLIFLHGLVFYFYLRTYLKKKSNFLILLVFILLSLVFFESVVSFQQLLASSPIYKNIEAQVNIEIFGFSADEFKFRFRPLGTFEHANMLGMWLSFVLSVIFATLFSSRTWSFGAKRSLGVFAVFIGGIFTLVVTLSRSSWMGAAFSFLLILFIVEKLKKVKAPEIFNKYAHIFLAISLFLFILFVFPRVEKTFYSFGEEGGGHFRTQQIKESFDMVVQNPLFGVGTDMSVLEGVSLNPTGAFASAPLPVHNWYLFVAAEQGIPALVFFLIFVILSIRMTVLNIPRMKMKKLEDYLAIGFLGGVLSLLIVGVFQPFVGEVLVILSVVTLQTMSGFNYGKN